MKATGGRLLRIGNGVSEGLAESIEPAHIMMALSERQKNGSTAEATVEIKNRLGLHLRAATTVAQTAARFASSIQIGRGKDLVNGRSVTALIMLGAGKGSKLLLRAEGSDAEAAVTELSRLFANGFGEQ